MEMNKFKVGDVITVDDPNDPSHFRRFQKIVRVENLIPGMVPYHVKSFQTDRTLTPEELDQGIADLRMSTLLYQPSRIAAPNISNKEYFEFIYRVLTDKEKLIYVSE